VLRMTWKVQACSKRMHSPGINGEGELRGQPANPGSPGKMAVKIECVWSSGGSIAIRKATLGLVLTPFLFLHFNGHFPGGPGLADTRMSSFWILLELRMMEVVVTTGAIRCAKFQSNRHHQETSAQLFTGQMPFLSPNQQCQITVAILLGVTLCQTKLVFLLWLILVHNSAAVN